METRSHIGAGASDHLERVLQVREALFQNSYHVDAEQLADCLIRKAGFIRNRREGQNRPRLLSREAVPSVIPMAPVMN